MNNVMTFDEVVCVLETLNELDNCEACIAGGWLRDKLNGVQPKDVDVFVCGEITRGEIENSLFFKYIGSPSLMLTPKYYGNYEECDMRDDVVGVLKYEKVNLDIIRMSSKNVEDIIDNFDVSVCQIYGKLNELGQIDVYVSRQYMDWVDHGIIYHYTNIPTSESHLNRVREKYNVDLTPVKYKHGQMEVVKIGTITE